MCPPRIHTLTLTLEGDGIRTWAFGRELDWEGGALTNGISALVEEASESPLAHSTM